MAWAALFGLVAVACGGSGASPPDAAPGVNSSRASRGGGLPDALAGNLDASGSDGAAMPPGAGGDGGAGGGAGGGAATAGGSGGTASPADAPAVEVAPEVAVAGACETAGVCERLNKEYVTALARAQGCQPGGSGQCLEMAPELLECPDCPVWVNSSEETTALQEQARAAGCNRCPRRCPARPCRALRRGACQPIGGILLPTGHACGEAGLLQ